MRVTFLLQVKENPMGLASTAEDCSTSENQEEVRDHLLYGGGVTALLGQVLHGLHSLLHQLGVVSLQLA